MNEDENRDVSIWLEGTPDEKPLGAFLVEMLDGWIEIQWFEGDTKREFIPSHRVVSVIG